MKRHLSLLLAVVMLLGSFSFAFAAKDVDPVEFLVDEGIIVGDEKTGDLMLYHSLKRQDAVVMLSRLMGEESIAKNFQVTARFPSFTDIKDPYYKPYIGWAEANEYVKGHSGKRAGEFGYNDYLTARQYAIILLRALGYVDEADNWDEAFYTASRLGLLDNVRASRDEEILRIEMAQMTFNALGTKINHSEKTLAEKLKIDMPVDKPATFELVDIKADNLKEVAVIFNQKVDEATVTDSNIKIKDGSRDIEGTATLQEDGYTVIVRVKEGALTNQKGYKVVVEKVKSIYGVEIAKVEETFKAFDAKLPEVEDIIVTGPRNFDIIFSEPIAKAGTVEIKQDKTKLGNKIGKVGDRRVSIDVYSNLQEGREYEVTISGFEDYAGYKNIINTMKFAYAKDIVPPVADIVKAEQTYVVVEFDKPVRGLNKNQFYHTFNAWNAVGIYHDPEYKEPVKDSDSVTKVYAVFYKIENGKPTSDSRAIPEGNVRFGINGNKVVDNWGNPLGQFEKTISVSADKTAPEITEIEVVEENLLRIKFNKNVTKPTVEILDENGRKIEKLTWNVSGSGKIYDVKLSKKMEGKVVMVIVKDVMDNTLMENKMATYTEYVEIVDKTRPEIVKAYYEIHKDDPRDKNKITGGKLAVIFDEDVDGDTALNFRSYALVYKEGTKDRVEPLSEIPYFDLNSARVMIPLTAKQAEIINDYHKLISPVKLQVIGVKDLAGNEIIPVVHKIDGAIEGVTSVEVLDIYAPANDRLVVKFADSLSNVKDDYFRISINGTPVDKRYIAINEDQNGGITKLEFVLGDKADKFATDLSGVVFEYTPGSKDGVENSFGKVIREMIATKDNKEKVNKFDKDVIADKIAPSIATIKIDGKDVDDIKWIENGRYIYIRFTEEIDKYALSSLTFEVANNRVLRGYRSEEHKNTAVIEVADNMTKAPEITQKYPVLDMHENEFKADKPFKATYTGKEAPVVDGVVNSIAIEAGKKLEESKLSGTFKNTFGELVKGTLVWDKPETVVNETGEFSWTFTPADSKRYVDVKGTVKVEVVKPADEDIINSVGEYTGDLNLNATGNEDIVYGPKEGVAKITGNVVINGDASSTITLKNIEIKGNLIVNTPNATVSNEAKVNGTININNIADGTWNEKIDGNKLVVDIKTKDKTIALNIGDKIKAKDLKLNTSTIVTVPVSGSIINPIEINANSTIISTKTVNAVVKKGVKVIVKENVEMLDEEAQVITGTGSKDIVPLTAKEVKKYTVEQAKDAKLIKELKAYEMEGAGIYREMPYKHRLYAQVDYAEEITNGSFTAIRWDIFAGDKLVATRTAKDKVFTERKGEKETGLTFYYNQAKYPVSDSWNVDKNEWIGKGETKPNKGENITKVVLTLESEKEVNIISLDVK